MPGAVSGVVKSVDRNKGIIVTKYGNIEFTNTSDSLKVFFYLTSAKKT
jgi:hypothetical protein